MKTCPHPKCGKIHNKPGVFCSRSCANSRTWSAETQAKRSESLKRYYGKTGKINRKTGKIEISEKQRAALKEGMELRKAWFLKRVIETPSHLLGEKSRRKKILLEQDGKCNNCGLDEWLGEDLVLEMEHKDGNKHNNKRENLEALCPNCHSQTPTWRGRNTKYADK